MEYKKSGIDVQCQVMSLVVGFQFRLRSEGGQNNLAQLVKHIHRLRDLKLETPTSTFRYVLEL